MNLGRVEVKAWAKWKKFRKAWGWGRCSKVSMESEQWDWEGLEVEEECFLRPCKRQTLINSNSPRLIPGPAGAVQASIMHRSPSHVDDDFNTNPWLSALQFLPDATPLTSINNHRRVPQVLALIKSCSPNGLGDMMLTLKDPTATIGATVHRNVFTHAQFRNHITVGSVLLLQKVAVFSTSRSTCYLNITLRNILKVFSKDSGPPSEQIYSAFSTPSIERHQKSRMLGNMLSLPQERTEGIMTSLKLDSRFFAAERHASSLPLERTEGIMTNLRSDSRFREAADVDKQKGENLVLTGYHSDNGSDGNQKTVSDRENLPLREDSARPLELTCDGDLESEMKEQPNPPKLTWRAQSNRSSTSGAQESGVKNHREILNPITSIPHWTEEQLDELLAFD